MKIARYEDADDDVYEAALKELDRLENALAYECAEENLKKVMENLGSFSSSEGSLNTNGMWKVKKKISPKNSAHCPLLRRILMAS